MPDDILRDVRQRLADDYGFKDKGTDGWWRKGKCPRCDRRELYTRYEAPWVVKCGRENNCRYEDHVKDIYPDAFESWSTRFKPTETNPTASADAYLLYKRGLNLLGMRDAYTQETFYDPARRIASATVRFALPGGSWWERLIDQESRFDRKAHFKPKSSVNGWWWQRPDQTMEDLARAEDLWIAEGVFDAWALSDAPPSGGGLAAVANLSTNFYPEHSLAELRRVCAALGVKGPRLVWAFDIGPGTEYTRRWVQRSIEEGWRATAAQPRPEGETAKLDWNDLKSRGRLTQKDIDAYLWNGLVLLAENATEKAMLLWQRHKWSSFHFVYESRTWWATFNEAKIAETMEKEGVSEAFAARHAGTVTEIANCAFRTLYFQADSKDEQNLEGQYFLRIDIPGQREVYKRPFSGAAITAGAEFKKRLASITPGGLWEGSTFQLDRIMSVQNRGLRIVKTIDFTGYSPDHQAWVLGDIAVHKGKVIRLNAEDYFDLGHVQIKLASPLRLLSIDYDNDRFDTSWFDDLWTAWRGNGLIALTFWVMSFFAVQIRMKQASLGYLEMWGAANTGKSTIVMFLWKLCGMADESYEGIDPSKSTLAGYTRTLARVSNLPVIFVEGDRNQDLPHTKKFDWLEIKGLFNGAIQRATGKKSQGHDINESPFRGALVIEQNDPVNSGEPILTRLMSCNWTKDGWSAATKAAAERIEQWPREDISDTMIHIIRREDAWMKAYLAAFPGWDAHMMAIKVRHSRIRKCHAQLHAGLDALAAVMKIDALRLTEGHAHIDAMARWRDRSVEIDHPIVADFWEAFDWLEQQQHTEAADPINRHRNPKAFVAVNLKHFEARCATARITAPSIDDLKRHLKTSKSRPFNSAGTVNGVGGDYAHCWIFAQPKSERGDTA